MHSRTIALALLGLSLSACGSSSPPSGASGATGPTVGGLFQSPNAWNQAVDSAQLSPNSAAMLSALEAAGGWGTGKIQIDFSMKILTADGFHPDGGVQSRPRLLPAGLRPAD